MNEIYQPRAGTDVADATIRSYEYITRFRSFVRDFSSTSLLNLKLVSELIFGDDLFTHLERNSLSEGDHWKR